MMAWRWTEELTSLCRLTRDFPRFTRRSISTEAALQAIRVRLANREGRFLASAKKFIYQNPQSPYAQLLRAADCEWEDLRALVYRDGLEAALDRLSKEGVYVTFDEFKGKKPAVRGSQTFHFTDRDFDNPLVDPHFVLWTGGTRNPAMAIRVSLDFAADMAVNTAVGLAAHSLSNHQHAYWMLSTAVTFALRILKLGRVPAAWFYPLPAMPGKGVWGARWLSLMSRGLGRSFPTPRWLDLQDPEQMMQWLAGFVRAGRSVCLTCYASSAVRVATVARERGVSLDRVCFVTLGEPLTAVKHQILQAAGAQVVDHYGCTEGGLLAYSCANPEAADDVHLSRDAFALVQADRPAGLAGETVPAFLFTSLLPTAPKIMLNVETGDYGQVSRRQCGCLLGSLGLVDHLSDIRSYEKLNGEGMTFVKSDLLHILDRALPDRFGGSGVDYQLLEEEDSSGVMKLSLLLHPKLGRVDEAVVRSVFLNALKQCGGPSRLGADTWEQAQTVQVVRRQPVVTNAGKILPFHLVQSGSNTRSIQRPA